MSQTERMKDFLRPKSKRKLRSFHFWLIVGLLTFITISHYQELLEAIPVLGQVSLNSIFGLERHTEDRFFYTLIILYASWILGTRIGSIVLLISAAAMLPRVFFISPNPKDAFLESVTVLLIGCLALLLFRTRQRVGTEQYKLQETVAKLHASEENYRELFDNASDAFWIHDLEGRITVANKASEDITGYPIPELLGKNVTDFLSEDARTLAGMVKSKLLEGEPPQRYEQRFFVRDGSVVTVELTTRLITQDGKPVAFQNIARDITERKNIEEMLSKIIDGSPIPSFVINKQHRVSHWNIAMESLCGIKKQRIVGTDEQWRPFYSEKRPVMADLIVDGASLDEISSYYRSSKESHLIDGAHEAEEFFQSLGRDGRWVHFTASPIKSESGEVVGAIETLEDVTERQKALEALDRSEKGFRDLFESALDAIWVHDLNGKIQVANEAAAKLAGYTLEELCQTNVKSFLSETALRLARETKTKLRQHQYTSSPYEQRLLKKDGTEIIVELTTRVITQDGQPVAFQNIARDVTQERKMRDSLHFYLQKVLVAQEEERKRIARELHDDTSQSLLLLIHRLDAMVSDPKTHLPEPVQEKLTQLHGLAVGTLANLRRYAQELRPAILDDMGLPAALEWMADSLMKEHGIHVDVQIGVLRHDLPREMQLTLFRIAQETLGNIRRHAEASDAIVRLMLRAGKVRMTISDNGKGFEVPKHLSDLSMGGKLGLVGMQERAQLLGGRLEILSEPGMGTTMIVEIPIEEKP